MSDDLLFAKWQHWSADIVRDVRRVARVRQIFQGIYELGRDSPVPKRYPTVPNWMTATFEVTALMLVRRQSDKHRSAASLRNLIAQIAKRPDLVSLERFRAMYATAPFPDDAVRAYFEREAGAGRQTLDGSAVEADLQELHAATARLEVVLDKRLAHLDPDANQRLIELGPVPWSTLHGALDTVERLTKRYHWLLTTMPVDLHAELPQDWLQVFREPW
jgi:hypothetical protein